MKELRKSWAFLAVFPLAAIVCLLYAHHAKAFTLVERSEFLPAVQFPLLAGVSANSITDSALIHVTNTSVDPVTVTLHFFGDTGPLMLPNGGGAVPAVHETINGGDTFVYGYTPAPGTDLRVVVTADHGGISSNIQINGPDGQIITVSPALLPAVQ